VHVVDPAGTRDRVLAGSRAHESQPAWAPDGSRIAFASARGSGRDLFVVDVQSGRVSNLTRSGGWEANPAWSPNGESIAFVKSQGLYVVLAAGGPLRRVSGFPEAREPHWAPGGSRIAFSGRGDCLRAGILVVPASGGRPGLLSNDCHIYGTEGADRLVGTWDRDVVFGRGGDDDMSLGQSSDVGYGERGNDVLRGERMNDVLVGGPGNDTLIGGNGNDRLWAADGEVDELACGAQVDRVVADRKDRVARDCERVRRVG
jgi:Tol biopolymer transport system component